MQKTSLHGWAQFVGVAAAVAALSLTASPAMSAEDTSREVAAVEQQQPGDELDRETYAGPVLIATPEGEVLVTVKAGELPAKAVEVRAAVASGSLDPNTTDERLEL